MISAFALGAAFALAVFVVVVRVVAVAVAVDAVVGGQLNDTVTCTDGLALAHGVISPTIADCGGPVHLPPSHLRATPYSSSTNLFVHSIFYNIPPSPSSTTAMAASRSALSALRLSARVCARPVIARSFQSARILRQGKVQRRDSC